MPFIRTAVLEDFALLIDHDAFYLWLNVETVRDTRQTVDDRFQRFLADRSRLGLARCIPVERSRSIL